MTRRADAERIRLVGRAAIRDTLSSAGKDRDAPDRWCDAWETEAFLQGLERGSDYWDAGRLWIDAQCAARKQPRGVATSALPL